MLKVKLFFERADLPLKYGNFLVEILVRFSNGIDLLDLFSESRDFSGSRCFLLFFVYKERLEMGNELRHLPPFFVLLF